MPYKYTKTSRRKLKAHTAGRDRHHKGTALLAKQERLAQERSSIQRRKKKEEV